MLKRYDDKDSWQAALMEMGYCEDTYSYWGYGSIEVFGVTDAHQRIAVWHGFYDCNVTENAEHGYIWHDDNDASHEPEYDASKADEYEDENEDIREKLMQKAGWK